MNIFAWPYRKGKSLGETFNKFCVRGFEKPRNAEIVSSVASVAGLLAGAYYGAQAFLLGAMVAVVGVASAFAVPAVAIPVAAFLAVVGASVAYVGYSIVAGSLGFGLTADGLYSSVKNSINDKVVSSPMPVSPRTDFTHAVTNDNNPSILDTKPAAKVGNKPVV